MQAWRVSELVSLLEDDAVALLRPHEEYILKGKVADGGVAAAAPGVPSVGTRGGATTGGGEPTSTVGGGGGSGGSGGEDGATSSGDGAEQGGGSGGGGGE